ncbi:hypothetical protein GCM10025867_04410 [Frondihabitans sucicola]|uniref:Bacterial Ig domain-containing protein n=1 Tax=Frondihabitans sucicola TaxID=1268041 RepID=A0ABM8GIJ4_9MICO|nr:Ig-like domain-containing protein [Frondihabitans sucicola]BDZ48200.1 hypothetical protein GCM10025867_04410 [Frondihabitans sucicola]
MRKILKGAGASALAAATVVTGLSFGPAATAAPSSSLATSPASVPVNGTKFKLVVPSAAKFVGYTKTSESARWNTYNTRAEAEAASMTARIVTEGDHFRAKIDDYSGSEVCLTAYTGMYDKTRLLGAGGASCSNESGLFRLDSQARMVSKLYGQYVTSTVFGETKSLVISASGTAAQFTGVNAGVMASVDSVDVVNRTAQISGTGKPNSSVVIGDDRDTPVGSDGKWSAKLENLNFGVNTIHLENWLPGSTKADSELDLKVELKVTDLSAVASATNNNADNVTISGAGQAGADVTIKDESGKPVATTTINASTGRYSATVAAPNAGGEHKFQVTQSIKESMPAPSRRRSTTAPPSPSPSRSTT